MHHKTWGEVVKWENKTGKNRKNNDSKKGKLKFSEFIEQEKYFCNEFSQNE